MPDVKQAREAHDYRLKPRAVAATFQYFARRTLKLGDDVLD
jgi:L-fuculose-phosphate aldolase